jgi:hypothetical protein
MFFYLFIIVGEVFNQLVKQALEVIKVKGVNMLDGRSQ